MAKRNLADIYRKLKQTRQDQTNTANAHFRKMLEIEYQLTNPRNPDTLANAVSRVPDKVVNALVGPFSRVSSELGDIRQALGRDGGAPWSALLAKVDKALAEMSGASSTMVKSRLEVTKALEQLSQSNGGIYDFLRVIRSSMAELAPAKQTNPTQYLPILATIRDAVKELRGDVAAVAAELDVNLSDQFQKLSDELRPESTNLRSSAAPNDYLAILGLWNQVGEPTESKDDRPLRAIIEGGLRNLREATSKQLATLLARQERVADAEAGRHKFTAERLQSMQETLSQVRGHQGAHTGLLRDHGKILELQGKVFTGFAEGYDAISQLLMDGADHQAELATNLDQQYAGIARSITDLENGLFTRLESLDANQSELREMLKTYSSKILSLEHAVSAAEYRTAERIKAVTAPLPFPVSEAGPSES